MDIGPKYWEMDICIYTYQVLINGHMWYVSKIDIGIKHWYMDIGIKHWEIDIVTKHH